MGKCSRCQTEASHKHVGALHSEDVELCADCFKAWRTLGEKVRLDFVSALTKAQKEFLGAADDPEITISETEPEDVDFEQWAIPPETIPTIPAPAALPKFEIDASPEFDQTDPNDSDV